MIGMGNTDNLDFIKLMKPVKSSDMSSPGACFPPEAWCICHIFNGKFFSIKNHIPLNIGNGNFSSGNEIEVIDIGMIHLPLLIWQLPRTKARILIYHYRWHNLQVTSFFSFIEKEIDQSSFQPGSFAFINRESGACQLNPKVKVNDVIFFNQVPVGKSRFRQYWNLSA